MKKLLGKLLLYVAFVVLANAIITALISNRYWERRVPVIKKGVIDKSGREVSLVLGSSHAFYGINSAVLGADFYNLASVSQSYFEDLAVLRAVLLSRSVKSVVVPISYASNNYYLSGSAEPGEQIRMLDYEHSFGMSYTHNLGYYKARLYLIAQTDKTLLQKPEKFSFDQYGNLQDTCKPVANNISDSLIAFFRHNLTGSLTSINPCLDTIISICSARNIKLNLVVFPFTGGYKRAFARKYARHEFDSLLANIRQRLSGSMRLIDCRNLITSGEPVYFRDADHLSACGRDSLSGYLSRMILQ